MNRRFPIIIPLLIGVGLFSIMFYGTSQRPDQSGSTAQGRNLIGRNTQGANPRGGLNIGQMIKGNQYTGTGIGTENRTGTGAGTGTGTETRTGNNTPDAVGIGATPGPGSTGNNTGFNTGKGTGYNTGTNTGMDRTGQQIRQQTSFNRQKADTLRNRLNGIYGIGQINTVVNGNTALVGYSRSISPMDGNTAVNMITNRVRQIDKTITNVIISDSADVSSRIRSLQDNIRDNRSENDLTNEFNQLIQSVGPVRQ